MAGIAQVIKYEGDNQTFIWKHPVEDFYTGSQLIVHESQEAVFFMNGQALDTFGPGRHTLESQNLPLVGKFFNRPTGDKTPFHCEVYFINKTEQMAIKWGTDSKVEYIEPTYGFPIKIGASGEMSLRAEESRKLLIKLVGTETLLTQAGLTAKFRMFLMTRVKTYIARFMKTEKVSIFEIDERLTEMSEALKAALVPDFADYGVALERFFVTTVVKPEDDADYRRFKDLHFRRYADIAEAELRQQVGVIEQETEAKRTVIEAQGIAEKRRIEGYTYQQERGYDVAERMAANEAVGEFANMGVGLGVMAGVGGSMGAAVGGMVQDSMSAAAAPAAPAGKVCAKCGAALPDNAKFCLGCGEKVEQDDGKVTCAKCGARTPKGKFCIECGSPLSNNCPKCGIELPEGAKFCFGCGEKLS